MLSVPDGARLIASAGSRSPQVDNAVAQTGLLERAGFTGADAVLAYIALSRYTIGAALEQQTARDGTEIVLPVEEGDGAAAHLARLAREVVTLGPDHEFEMGLAALIHGLEHLLHRCGAAAPTSTLS